MGVTGTVHHDLRGLEERLRLHPKELLAADVRTRNRVATQSRAEGVRRLRPEFRGLKAATIRKLLRIDYARRADPRATLEFSSRRLALWGRKGPNFSFSTFASKYGRGVKLSELPFRVELDDGTTVTAAHLRRLFLQVNRWGRPAVLVREGKPSLPIQVLRAPSMSDAFRERGVGAALIAYGRTRMRVVFAQETKFRVSRRLSRGG